MLSMLDKGIKNRCLMSNIGQRKSDHLKLAIQGQLSANSVDDRFYYEPLMSPHPTNDDSLQLQKNFLGKTVSAPIWVSSMTGGHGSAGKINKILAKVCGEFGLGMGLGSCRVLLENPDTFEDFNLRELLGDSVPFYANLGIAQLENYLDTNKLDHVKGMVDRLNCDGLIIHINPLQEWFQPEGDRFYFSPIETLSKLLDKVQFPIVVKEVGQGMGPQSLLELMKLPLQAIEFGAFGGTNFSLLEKLRDKSNYGNLHESLCFVGHSAEEMVQFVNENSISLGTSKKCHEYIISGGVQTYLDGYFLMESLNENSIYGQAKAFLEKANEGEDVLREFVAAQISGLNLAKNFLKIKHNKLGGI